MGELGRTYFVRFFRGAILVVGCIAVWPSCSDAECDQKICTLTCDSTDAVLTCTRGSVTAEVLTRTALGQVEDYRLRSSLGLFTTCRNTYVGTERTSYSCFGECLECNCKLVTRFGLPACSE